MYRKEYPRPQLKRNNWMNLNGEWQFAFDEKDEGIKDKWFLNDRTLEQKIEVPFVFQSERSGIDDQSPHEIVWYKKQFAVSDELGQEEVVLHFGAVDYHAMVFVNESFVGEHTGGHTSFSFDITPYLEKETQDITVRVYDPRYDETIPRGKQTWQEKPHSIWYTNSTGIWQTVWLEGVSRTHINHVYFTPDIDTGSVNINVDLAEWIKGQTISYTIRFQEEVVASGSWAVQSSHNETAVQLYQENIYRSPFHDHGWNWSPEHPNLFDVTLTVYQNEEKLDEIESYFGMRKIHTEKGMVYLNNKPYYQKLVLDQGYWPETLMTAPDDEAFKKDIELALEMGFNGCRKHQKVEDPRFLYWADKLGFLVWGESPSAHFFSEKSVDRLTNEWNEIIQRDYNHPSIVTWVPFNESWGINEVQRNNRQQHYSQTLYHMVHALDSTRPVISNDGWEMTVTDICAVHHYNHGEMDEPEKYARFQYELKTKQHLLHSQPANRSLYAEGFAHKGEPIILTEFGGIGYRTGETAGWGYTTVSSSEEFVSEYGRVVEAVLQSEALHGFCYTQLYDVEQEINGLLTYSREPKCDLKQIKEINNRYHPPVVSEGKAEY